ncbi:MAG: glycosyltransferase N-terminal domain-containing protein [Prevotella sp.]|nr:glycosyltransferase N-terminal domain-containing protein [Prevotellaceae bacterium]MDY5844335.1 glycosyltransferase N-terminal domain-containing protein [Prevotella sp.]
MYQVAIYLYLCGVAVASIFSKKVKKMWKGERQTLDILKSKVNPNHQYIWFHAASLGEFEQGRPLIERIRADYPEYKILLTFFSPSGYEVRKNYEHADIVCYLPIDTIRNARRFLRTVRPCMAFFIKYEFWYNYLHILKHRNVPVYSVSSIFRENQIFFRWYGKSYAGVLRCFTHFFVQNEKSKHLLHTIGIDTVDVVGDTRFDRVLQIKEKAQQLPIVEAFKADKKVFVAGSSWAPDEDIFIPFMNECKDWKMIIAPHVISEEHLKRIEEKCKGKTVRYTATTPEEAAQAQCLLIDCFGLLSSVYHYGEVAYVGGGFGVGIHNVLEAVVWKMPVLFGPNHQRFQEAQELIKTKGGFEITDSSSFARIMQQFMTQQEYLRLSGEAAGSYVESKAGATHKILKQIDL